MGGIKTMIASGAISAALAGSAAAATVDAYEVISGGKSVTVTADFGSTGYATTDPSFLLSNSAGLAFWTFNLDLGSLVSSFVSFVNLLQVPGDRVELSAIAQEVSGTSYTGAFSVDADIDDLFGSDTVLVSFSAPSLVGDLSGTSISIQDAQLGQTATIPLPAGLFLLMAGVGAFAGLGASRRRKTSSSADR